MSIQVKISKDSDDDDSVSNPPCPMHLLTNAGLGQ